MFLESDECLTSEHQGRNSRGPQVRLTEDARQLLGGARVAID
jgi:hypothetical protein